MKITISRELFLEGLQTVQNVVSTRTSLPILGNVLIRAEGDEVSFSTTDLDTGIRATVDAQVDRSGAITLPARRLFSIARELPSAEVFLEVDSKLGATIRAGSAFFKIMGMPEDDFPPFPRTENANLFQIEQKVFRDMLKKTAYAMSTDESRYVLNGVLLSFKDGKLTVVATDGRRLALVDQELEFPKSAERDCILPTKAVNELLRSLDHEGEVEIALAENQIAFTLGRVFLVSKLIEGNYPNYRQVIPGNVTQRVTIERELLLDAVRRVALLSSEKSNSVKLHFTENQLEVTATTPEVGEARESLVVKYNGPKFTIAFNPNFLLDPLRHLDGDEIYLDLIDELSPGVIRYQKPFLYVIMPMRTA